MTSWAPTKKRKRQFCEFVTGFWDGENVTPLRGCWWPPTFGDEKVTTGSSPELFFFLGPLCRFPWYSFTPEGYSMWVWSHVFAFFPKEAKTTTPGRGERELLESRILLTMKKPWFNHWGVLEFWVVWNFFGFWWIFLGGYFKMYRPKQILFKTNHHKPLRNIWFLLVLRIVSIPETPFFSRFCPAKRVPQKYLRSET